MATIRLATAHDLPELCALLGELFAQEAEFSADAEAQSRGLRRILAAPDTGEILLLAELDAVIGMVSLLYLTSSALGSRVALLEDMIIAPGHRGGGHGDRLLRAAIDHARMRHCRRITLLTDHDNSGAQRFYGRHGFEMSQMRAMRLQLD